MSVRSFLVVAAAVVAVACVVMFWRHGGGGDAGLQHWLGIHTGTLNEPGGYYGFWSGFGSDLGEVALLGAVGGLWHKHNCHTSGCWRIGRHVVDGSPWCNRHHEAARAAVAPVEVTDVSCGHCGRLADQVADLAEAVRAVVAPKGTRL